MRYHESVNIPYCGESDPDDPDDQETNGLSCETEDYSDCIVSFDNMNNAHHTLLHWHNKFGHAEFGFLINLASKFYLTK